MSAPVYTIANLVKRYGARSVLRIPALTVEQGEILALVGPSGAGKSTLLRLMALLEAPSTGSVTLHAGAEPVDYASATIEQRRQLVMVFQRPALLSRSVYANVAYGLRMRGQRDGRARIEAVLKRVALDHLSNARPNTLSGGEMQRVAVARALICEPRILLLDEPTANLDPYNVRLIESLVSEQHALHGATVVLVTHNVFQARRLATRVALVLDGEVIEAAPTEAFFTAPRDPRTAAFVSGDLVY
jgi:tungstate transport system ATP-binding protein